MEFPSIEPDSADWRIETNTAEFSSDLNMSVQHMPMQGARWRATLTFSNRDGADSRRLKGFVFGLQGPVGRFDLSPPDLNQQGSMAGSGAVNGANQTGTTLVTSGWTVSQGLLFDYGDYFEVGGELKMITVPASSDASGNAALQFVPPLRRSPANTAPIEVTDPRARNCYLANDDQASAGLTAPIIYAVTIDVVEDVTP